MRRVCINNIHNKCAPTGTVSLLAQVSSGMEPIFLPFYMRRKKVNLGDDVRVDFTDQNGDTWQEFAVLHHKFKDWLISIESFKSVEEEKEYIERVENLSKEDLEYWFEKSPWYKSTANDIDWLKRVEMQGTIQKYTSHSISSTINLPNDVAKQEVSDIYLHSWKQGLKGITVYRDGSRSGVLVAETTKEEDFSEHNAPKRPQTLDCNIHETFIAGQKFNVIVGLMNDKPYEVFIDSHFTNETSMQLTKVRSGRYDLEKDGKTYSEDITTEMTDEQEFATRLISMSLRHGANIKYLVEQSGKTSGNITSYSSAIARVLKTYIKEGEKSTLKCNDCKSNNVIFEEGCSKCLDCGSSKCG